MLHPQLNSSGRFEEVVDMPDLFEVVGAAAVKNETLPCGRVPDTRNGNWAVADGSPVRGFLDVSIRCHGGRAPRVARANNPDFPPATGTIRNHLENLS